MELTGGGGAPLLRVAGLRKRYPSFELRDVSLEVPAGRIVGFVGRNGAGKTTTLRCVAGAARADAGTVEVLGRSAEGDWARARGLMGIVLGGALYYETKTLAAIAGVSSRIFDSWDARTFDALARRFSLDTGKRVRELSQGMRVKFALALALSHGARLLVLDEPTSGLDPLSRDELLDLLLDLVASGERGVLFSTHITSDLDKCADDIVHIRRGRVEAACPLAEYRTRYRVAPAEEARSAGARVLGTRRTASGETALVPATAGIGEAADLEQIMTHLDREDGR
ncbi:ABC transporter ATP-binding protein [Collinsella sp. An271]|uniref:ABC transporter ATP-binding protein n=1 Tax=Collinsella sp. An271 TaxID=1965616 RepID=UPI0013024E3E|nr:ABC transporter ATP-binding protein [Collinsella sp. An271]